MKWTTLSIRKAFGGRLVGVPPMEEIICRAVLLLPDETIKLVTSTVWIISSPLDAWAMTFRGDEIQNRHLVFLSDELLRQDEKQITYTFLHEIGHVVLNHRNSIGYEQTESEIKQQERDADLFAKQYIK